MFGGCYDILHGIVVFLTNYAKLIKLFDIAMLKNTKWMFYLTVIRLFCISYYIENNHYINKLN